MPLELNREQKICLKFLPKKNKQTLRRPVNRTCVLPKMVVDKDLLNLKRQSKSEIDTNDNHQLVNENRFSVDKKDINMMDRKINKAFSDHQSPVAKREVDLSDDSGSDGPVSHERKNTATFGGNADGKNLYESLLGSDEECKHARVCYTDAIPTDSSGTAEALLSAKVNIIGKIFNKPVRLNLYDEGKLEYDVKVGVFFGKKAL